MSKKNEAVDEMVEWFFAMYEDPAESTPFESAEGGYQYIWGGPYDAKQVLLEKYEHLYREPWIDDAVKAIEEQERGGPDWVLINPVNSADETEPADPEGEEHEQE